MTSKHKQTAFALLRITMGINIMVHGLVRIPKLNDFSSWIVDSFKNTIIPAWSLLLWGNTLPYLEFIIGFFLTIGLFTYKASVSGALLILSLLFGSCLLEKWEWASIQMIYALFYYFIINNLEENFISIDHFLFSKNQ